MFTKNFLQGYKWMNTFDCSLIHINSWNEVSPLRSIFVKKKIFSLGFLYSECFWSLCTFNEISFRKFSFPSAKLLILKNIVIWNGVIYTRNVTTDFHRFTAWCPPRCVSSFRSQWSVITRSSLPFDGSLYYIQHRSTFRLSPQEGTWNQSMFAMYSKCIVLLNNFVFSEANTLLFHLLKQLPE